MSTELNEKSTGLDPGLSEKHAGIPESTHEGGLTKDGVKIHPQPTADPLDPLNWSTSWKYLILGVVMWKYFLFTYITTTTVPSFAQLGEQFNIGNNQLNWTVAIPALGLAAGPLIFSSLSDIYGRRIIFIFGTIIALVSSIGAAVASTYGGYMAARFFQGLGVSPAATVGLAVINDLFFDSQRGQAFGLWVLAIDSGLLIGPLIGGFIDLVSAAWIQWLTAILFAGLLAAELAFMRETLYPRNYMLQRMPLTSQDIGTADIEKMSRQTGSASDVELKRTTQLFFLNFRPVPGLKHPKPWDSIIRFGLTFKYPVVVISIGVYCFTWYWWVLSIITEIPFAYPQYSPQVQGLFFLGLFLGTIFSEVLCSGRLSDYIMFKLAKKNNNVRVAEMRLWLVYPAALLSALGLIIWGISIDKMYHWIVGQIAFFLFAAGIQMGNTAISSYVVDAYPLNSMSVITFYAVFLNLSAFINPFFIAPWVAASGYTLTFAAQGIITFFGAVPAIALLHKFGPSMRAKAGQPGWVNPEFDSSI